MNHVALIVQPGATPSSVMATLDIFRIADRFLPPQRRVQLDLLSVKGGAVSLSDNVSVRAAPLPASLALYQAVILPGFFAEDIGTLVGKLRTIWRPVIDCLRAQEDGPLLAASCYGTFVLAESGRLDGREATTSWWFQREFAQRYPAVRLNADEALVVDGRLISAGAMTAHIDLTMQVLRTLEGAELARNVAAIMLVNDARSSQRPFMLLPRRFADTLVQRAADWMAEHLAHPFSVHELAAGCHTSYRTLHRRFTQAAGQSPLDYLQALRMEHAKVLLEDGRMGLEEIVARVGYADAASFRRLFRRRVGMSVGSYRRGRPAP